MMYLVGAFACLFQIFDPFNAHILLDDKISQSYHNLPILLSKQKPSKDRK